MSIGSIIMKYIIKMQYRKYTRIWSMQHNDYLKITHGDCVDVFLAPLVYESKYLVES